MKLQRMLLAVGLACIAPIAAAQEKTHTVHCQTGKGFNIWRVDWDEFTVTEMLTGDVLDIVNMVNLHSGENVIMATSDPDLDPEFNSFITLDLYYEGDDSDDYPDITIIRQKANWLRGWERTARHDKWAGSCERSRGKWSD